MNIQNITKSYIFNIFFKHINSLLTLAIRFFHIKDIAGKKSQNRGRYFDQIYITKRIFLISWFIFVYTGIKILHVKSGKYGVMKCLSARTNNYSAALKLLQQTET